MKRILIIFLFLFLFVMPGYISAQVGYWYENEFIELIPTRDSTIFVQTRNTHDFEDIKTLKNRDIKSSYVIGSNRLIVKAVDRLNTENCFAGPVYTDIKKKNKYIILPEILLCAEEDIVKSIQKEYSDCISLERIVNGGISKFGCKLSAPEDVLRLVMKIVERGDVKWCEPNMILDTKSFNTYYSQQYYLHKSNSTNVDINVLPAWNITSGNGSIKVAVIDEGVDRTHEDLMDNISNGYTTAIPNGAGNPISSFFRHGTACAGIIAAKDNSIGIRGVASNVKIMPVNITTGNTWPDGSTIFVDNDSIASAIIWAYENDADILSCSWGGESVCNAITSAINTARTYGRNGKGCVVVCASGNFYPNYPNEVAFPARMNGVLAVGAVDKWGNICNYSQRGSSLNLVAPSNQNYSSGDIYTTTNTGWGNVSSNYTSQFGGTSAACPQVAGVAALLLSIRPDLTESQARTVLQNTATDLGTSGFDTTYGYGLVNAGAALNSVDYKITGPTLISNYSDYEVSPLPSGYTVTWSLSNSYYNSNCLQQNTPSTNKCRITRNSSHDMLDATLTATIKYNGNIVRKITKSHLYAYSGFKGTYYNGVTTKQVNLPYPLYVKNNANLSLQSPNLINATVTHEGDAAVSSFSFNSTTGTVNFYLTSNGTCLVRVNCVNGDHFDLPFIVTDNTNILNVAIGNGQLEVSLVPVGEEELRNLGYADQAENLLKSEPQQWTLEVFSATTGEKVFSQTVEGSSFTIDTTGWKPGVYVVRAIIGDEVLNEKVVVN